LNYFQAQDLLDQVRHGHNAPSFLVDKALELTGDLSCGTFCEDGLESRVYRSRQTPSEGIGARRDWYVGGSRPSSSQTTEGVA
jgi:hypothetical protein